MRLDSVVLTAVLCGATAAFVTWKLMPVKDVPLVREGRVVEENAPTAPTAQDSKSQAAVPEQRSTSTVTRQVLDLQYDVECTVEVNVGATVTWLADDNPMFAKGDLVRPVSVMGIAVWKEIVISTTHVLLWRKVDSEEGIGSEVSVLGNGFSSDADVPPRCLLSLDVRPRFETWGKVSSVNDIVISAGLELAPAKPLENPTPTVLNPH